MEFNTDTVQQLFDFFLFITIWTGLLVGGGFVIWLISRFLRMWSDMRWHREQAKFDRRNR